MAFCCCPTSSLWGSCPQMAGRLPCRPPRALCTVPPTVPTLTGTSEPCACAGPEMIPVLSSGFAEPQRIAFPPQIQYTDYGKVSFLLLRSQWPHIWRLKPMHFLFHSLRGPRWGVHPGSSLQRLRRLKSRGQCGGVLPGALGEAASPLIEVVSRCSSSGGRTDPASWRVWGAASDSRGGLCSCHVVPSTCKEAEFSCAPHFPGLSCCCCCCWTERTFCC